GPTFPRAWHPPPPSRDPPPAIPARRRAPRRPPRTPGGPRWPDPLPGRYARRTRRNPSSRQGHLTIGARRHNTQALLERLRLPREQRGVIDGVGHHVLYVQARFGERYGLGEYRTLYRCGQLGTPLHRPTRTRVVTGRRQDLRAVQVVQNHAQVTGAENGVGLELVDARRMEVRHANLLRDPFRGGRHQLHQTRRPHAGTRIGDEAGFLADQAVDPRRIKIDLACLLRHLPFERRNETLPQVDFLLGAQGGVHHAIVDVLFPRELGGGQQFTVVHATQVEVPLRHGLRPPAEFEQGHGTLQAFMIACGLKFSGCQRRRRGRQSLRRAEFFAGQLPIETEVVRDRTVMLGRRLLVAQRLQGARVPINPDRLGGLSRRHAADRLGDLVPIDSGLAQFGTNLPSVVVVGHAEIARLAIPLGRIQLDIQRGYQPELAPDPFHIGARQTLRPIRLDPCRVFETLVAIGHARQCDGCEFHLRRCTRWLTALQPLARIVHDGGVGAHLGTVEHNRGQAPGIAVAIGLQRRPQQALHVRPTDDAAFVELIEHRPAGGVRLKGFNRGFGTDLAAAHVLGHQHRAFDLGVLSFDGQQRENLLVITRPSGCHQPFALQAISKVGIAVALEEVMNLALRDGLRRVQQALAQRPVPHVGPQHRIPIGQGDERAQAVPLLGLHRVARLHYGITRLGRYDQPNALRFIRGGKGRHHRGRRRFRHQGLAEIHLTDDFIQHGVLLGRRCRTRRETDRVSDQGQPSSATGKAPTTLRHGLPIHWPIGYHLASFLPDTAMNENKENNAVQLRTRLKALRAAQNPLDTNRGGLLIRGRLYTWLATNVTRLREAGLPTPQHIAAFWSMPEEPQLLPMLRQWVEEDGYQVSLP